jgi:hypothetical protein
MSPDSTRITHYSSHSDSHIVTGFEGSLIIHPSDAS